MAKNFAKEFYNSAAWKACREAYKKKAVYLCERCGNPGEIVHHKARVTPKTINDPSILLDFKNLELLCRSCHAKEHEAEYKRRFKDKFADRRYTVDADGRVTAKDDCEY